LILVGFYKDINMTLKRTKYLKELFLFKIEVD